jgi:hypothetical protein
LTFARPSYIFWLDHLAFYFNFCSTILHLFLTYARPSCICFARNLTFFV